MLVLGTQQPLWICRWCIGGTHLIVTSSDYPSGIYNFSTYQGVQLINTFMQSGQYQVAAASVGATVLHLADKQWPLAQCSIRTLLRDGTLLAEHCNLAFSRGDIYESDWQGGSLLAIATSTETLYVCSPAGQLHTISLSRPAAQASQVCTQVSSHGQLAVVCIIGVQAEVLVVDLAQQHVSHRHSLPGPEDSSFQCRELVIAQSSRSVALSNFQHLVTGDEGRRVGENTIVLATSGSDAGCLVLPGASSLSWDLLGRFLALQTLSSLRVYDMAGTCLATCPRLPALLEYSRVQWHSETSELMWMGLWTSSRGIPSTLLLRFGCG